MSKGTKNTMTREEIDMELRSLDGALCSSNSSCGDWKVTKCQEYVLAGLEAPYDVEELHAQRQAIRDRINELQQMLDNMDAEE